MRTPGPNQRYTSRADTLPKATTDRPDPGVSQSMSPGRVAHPTLTTFPPQESLSARLQRLEEKLDWLIEKAKGRD